VFVAYIREIYKPVRTMARISARFSKASVSAERISEILEIEPEITDAPDAVEASGLRGEIVFDNVSFGYEPGKSILRDVSFSIPAGRRVALVGASGAGKSTIANLILRLYDTTQGRVLVDGVDVRRYRRESLRREIGVVLQDTILFGTTIRENIAYGKPEATTRRSSRPPARCMPTSSSPRCRTATTRNSARAAARCRAASASASRWRGRWSSARRS